jgi:hypothetical protein
LAAALAAALAATLAATLAAALAATLAAALAATFAAALAATLATALALCQDDEIRSAGQVAKADTRGCSQRQRGSSGRDVKRAASCD